MYIYHHVVHFKYVILVLSYTSVKLEKNEKENASLQEKSLENSKKHKILQVKIKKAVDAFELLEKTLQIPLDSEEINQLILKEINPEYSLEGPMLKLQYFGHLMWSTDSLEKTLMLGKIEGKKRMGSRR